MQSLPNILNKIPKGIFATSNSKEITEGSIFFALQGKNFDGHDFMQDALLKGASFIFHSSHSEPNEKLICIPNLEELLPDILNYIYDISLNITAITGTNGKTSTAFFCAQGFALLGVKSAFIGTIGSFICTNESIVQISNAELTTPDIISFYRILHQIKEQGVSEVFFEASSIGIHQGRIRGVKIKNAIFTNFTQDHLDYHKTMEEYFESKLLLFSSFLLQSGMAIVNIEDEKSTEIQQICKHRGIECFTAGFKKGDLQIINYKTSVQNIVFDCNYFTKGEVNLTGEFQLSNIYLVILFLIKSGFNALEVKNILPKLKAPAGRMEHIKNNIFIDYAHTPDSLLKALSTLNSLKKEGKVIVLFGCGGDRDKSKRPLMGAIATKYSDFAIITDDNPRTENAEEIRKDITKGCTGTNFKEIAQREAAIKEAIKLKSSNDILLIAGKGHEAYQIIGNHKFDFNEKEIILNALQLQN